MESVSCIMAVRDAMLSYVSLLAVRRTLPIL